MGYRLLLALACAVCATASDVISSQQEPTISAATLLLPASATRIRATISTTLGCFHWCVSAVAARLFFLSLSLSLSVAV